MARKGPYMCCFSKVAVTLDAFDAPASGRDD
jgi:hypothetical protein